MGNIFKTVIVVIITLVCLLAILVSGIYAFDYFPREKVKGKTIIIPDQSASEDTTAMKASGLSKKPPKMLLELGEIVSLPGKSSLMASLYGRPPGSSSRSSMRAGYATERGQIRNVLFLNGEDFSPHWLLKNNRSVISNISYVLQSEDALLVKTYLSGTESNDDALAMIFQIINGDSNNDEKLTHLDKKRIVITDDRGLKKALLIDSVDSVKEIQVNSQTNNLNLLVQNGSELVLYFFELTEFTKLGQSVLVDLTQPQYQTEADLNN